MNVIFSHSKLPIGIVVLLASISSALALDPRRDGYYYEYTLYPPDDFSVKKSKAVLRADPKGSPTADLERIAKAVF